MAEGEGVQAVHPAIRPLSFLLGTWKGQGEGSYPPYVSPFFYSEQLDFSETPNKPVIAYSQKTWKLNSAEPMHAESGYWRPKPDGTIEVVIAQSTGLAEVQKGTYDAKGNVMLKSTFIGNASKVKEITRHFMIENEKLSYVVEMATNVTSLQTHLRATLEKISHPPS